MELLKTHRSIRKFSASPVPDPVLTDILEAGTRGSNTGNMQLYSIIVSQSIEKRAILAPLHFNQSMVTDAPVLLTICFDLNRFTLWCEANGTQTEYFNLLWLINGTIDASILAQNICIAAENVGLGICYLGTTLYNAPEISKILNLPVGVIPITALSIGYPEQIPDLTDRLPLNAVVHFEEYQDYSTESIKEIYSEKENLESSQAYVKENEKNNLAQVYTEVRYKSADNKYFSKKLIQMLLEQGFKFDL